MIATLTVALPDFSISIKNYMVAKLETKTYTSVVNENRIDDKAESGILPLLRAANDSSCFFRFSWQRRWQRPRKADCMRHAVDKERFEEASN